MTYFKRSVWLVIWHSHDVFKTGLRGCSSKSRVMPRCTCQSFNDIMSSLFFLWVNHRAHPLYNTCRNHVIKCGFLCDTHGACVFVTINVEPTIACDGQVRGGRSGFYLWSLCRNNIDMVIETVTWKAENLKFLEHLELFMIQWSDSMIGFTTWVGWVSWINSFLNGLIATRFFSSTHKVSDATLGIPNDGFGLHRTWRVSQLPSRDGHEQVWMNGPWMGHRSLQL